MATNYINRTISVLYRYGQRFFAGKIRERKLGFDVGQIPFLLRLYREPGISQDQLSERIGMDKGTTAKCLKQMEENGLIVRRADEHDRRVNHIYPTEQALQMQESVRQLIRDLHRYTITDWTSKKLNRQPFFWKK